MLDHATIVFSQKRSNEIVTELLQILKYVGSQIEECLLIVTLQ